MNQVGLQIQRKLTFYVSLANLHRNYFCQLIIHTHTNSRQSKFYILSYSVRWNWIMVSDGEKKFGCHDSCQKHTTFFIHANMISWFKGDIWLWFFTSFQFFYHQIRKKILKKVAVLVSDRIFCISSCFFHTKLVKFWNYLPSTNTTSPGVYIPVIAFWKLKISLSLSF